MEFSGKFQIAAIVMVSMLGLSRALMCYECLSYTSSSSNNCKNPTGMTPHSCSSKCYFTYGKVGDVETYNRGCAGALTPAFCTEIDTSANGAEARHSCCSDKDLCNGAPTAKVTTGVFVLAGLAAYLLGY